MGGAKGAEAADNSIEALELDLWDELGKGEPTLDRQEAEDGDEGAAEEQVAPAPVEQAGPAVRLAWSAAYGIKATAIAVAVFVASALALTMVLNPDLTLLDAINLYIERIGDFAGHIGETA